MGTAIHVTRARAPFPGPQNSSPTHGSGGLRLTISIDNLSHILSVYGADAVSAARATIELALDALRIDGCGAAMSCFDRVEISFGHHSPAQAASLAETLIARLSRQPVRLGDQVFHLALGCPAVAGMLPAASPSIVPVCPPVGEGEDWLPRYRGDMALAAECFAAIEEERLFLNWQAVQSSAEPGDILYHEGLARIFGLDGQPISLCDVIPVLERLGLARAFDHAVLALVMRELEDHPGVVLGANVSGQSARLDGWWSTLLARLERNPDAASRLVVEITETAALDPGVHDFISALRRLGCRVALDDFGVGHASIRNALVLSPDIIKIDSFFVRRAGMLGDHLDLFEHLLGLAGSIAPVVIVEGVETREQSLLAEGLQMLACARGGTCWQQGYYFGRPTSWRTWRYAGDEAKVVPLHQLAVARGSFQPRRHYAGLGAQKHGA